MSSSVEPTFESIDNEYKRISGLLGEAYVNYDLARKRLRELMRNRDAVLAQYRVHQQTQAAIAKAKEVQANDGE